MNRHARPRPVRWWPRCAVAIAVTAVLSAIAAAPPTARALPNCPQSGSHFGYRIHLDGTLALLYRGQAPSDRLSKRLRDQLVAALEFLDLSYPPQVQAAGTRARALTCEQRNPRVEGDFDATELGTLDGTHVLLESWLHVDSDVDDEDRPLQVVTLASLLVPVAASGDGVPPNAPTVLSVERRVPAGARNAELRKQLAIDRELAAVTFTCTAIKRMRAKQYDDAHACLLAALAAIRELTDPDRRGALARVEALAVGVAWENWRRARADDANPSDVRLVEETDLRDAVGGTP